MVSMVMPYYILVSLAFGYFLSLVFGYFLSLYPGKWSEKHGQSFTEHAINSPARSAERHYCDVGKHSV